MENKIIQASPSHTGSTLLLNLIHGFLAPAEQIHWKTENKIHNHLITKTHNTSVDNLIEQFKQYKLWFVMSERNDEKTCKLIDDKYRKHRRVLIINYNEINETPSLSLDNIVENIFHKFVKFFPKNLIPKKDSNAIKLDMKNRVIEMNKVTEEIKSKPFEYWDKFYGVHGSHRNRNR
uniref:Sulfotransferase domain-containing protein n=1 Tax=viral metagenome TaxID=1070528 RepID=A0A6C0LLC6_9ZZZZ